MQGWEFVWYTIMVWAGILLIAFLCGMLYAFNKKIAWALFLLFIVFFAMAVIYVVIAYRDNPSAWSYDWSTNLGWILGGLTWSIAMKGGERTYERIRREVKA